MIKRLQALETGRLLGLIALVLALAVVVNSMFVQPQKGRLRRLAAERMRLMTQIEKQNQDDQLNRGLARFLRVNELTDLNQDGIGDPLTYLGTQLDRSRLTRLDITTSDIKESILLIRTSFTVRVLGDYSRILEFVKALESGARICTVDAFEIQQLSTSDGMETRLTVSIWDPKK